MDPSTVASIDMIGRWQKFAQFLAADHGPKQEATENERGELIVLGSGLAHVDLLLNDEATI